MLLNCDVGEDSWESLGLQGDPTDPSSRKSVLNIHWCWSWNSNTLATWWGEKIPLKRLWCCERLKAGGEGADRGWDFWMASLTWWTWIWASCGSWWWTGKPGMLQSMGLQRVGNDWAIELILFFCFLYFALKDRCKYILLGFISKDILSVFSSRYFMVSGLKFSYSIHFYFFLYMLWGNVLIFLFYMWLPNFSSTNY